LVLFSFKKKYFLKILFNIRYVNRYKFYDEITLKVSKESLEILKSAFVICLDN